MQSEVASSSDAEMTSQEDKDFFASSPPDSKNIKSSPSAFSPLSSPPQHRRDSHSPSPQSSKAANALKNGENSDEYMKSKGKENNRVNGKRERSQEEEEEEDVKPKIRDGPLFLSNGNDEVDEVEEEPEGQDEMDHDVKPDLSSRASGSRDKPPSKRTKVSSPYPSPASHQYDSEYRQPQAPIQEDPELDSWESRFLGSFIIEAYSASKKLRSGQVVKVEHNKPEDLKARNSVNNVLMKKKKKVTDDNIVRMSTNGEFHF